MRQDFSLQAHPARQATNRAVSSNLNSCRVGAEDRMNGIIRMIDTSDARAANVRIRRLHHLSILQIRSILSSAGLDCGAAALTTQT